DASGAASQEDTVHEHGQDCSDGEDPGVGAPRAARAGIQGAQPLRASAIQGRLPPTGGGRRSGFRAGYAPQREEPLALERARPSAECAGGLEGAQSMTVAVQEKPVQLFRPLVPEDAVAAAADVLRSGWIGLGPKTEEFEREFARFAGS